MKKTTTAAAKVSTPKAAAPRKAPAKKAPATKAVPTPEQRYRMVQEAAYYLAMQYDFMGDAQGYWLEAEKQIAAQLGEE